MKISTKQLRVEPGRIISQVNDGQDVTITYRGKPCAKIVSIAERTPAYPSIDDSSDELFGIWKDRKDLDSVEMYVRSLRKGRKFDN